MLRLALINLLNITPCGLATGRKSENSQDKCPAMFSQMSSPLGLGGFTLPLYRFLMRVLGHIYGLA